MKIYTLVKDSEIDEAGLQLLKFVAKDGNTSGAPVVKQTSAELPST